MKDFLEYLAYDQEDLICIAAIMDATLQALPKDLASVIIRKIYDPTAVSSCQRREAGGLRGRFPEVPVSNHGYGTTCGIRRQKDAADSDDCRGTGEGRSSRGYQETSRVRKHGEAAGGAV
jgi:hypothetical protein